ncbi:MAG: DUF5753 domain-containing protein [Actinomycetota bacterium]|nr:DUF5753 domain-containing protein [Actinomycetota bacterium]
MLQTEGYARALMDAGRAIQRPDLNVETVISARLARQQRLVEADPLVLHVLLDEATIVRGGGGPEVMGEQLAALLVAADRENITLQVVPFGAGAYGSMSGSLVIVDYPQEDETPASTSNIQPVGLGRTIRTTCSASPARSMRSPRWRCRPRRRPIWQ